MQVRLGHQLLSCRTIGVPIRPSECSKSGRERRLHSVVQAVNTLLGLEHSLSLKETASMETVNNLNKEYSFPVPW